MQKCFIKGIAVVVIFFAGILLAGIINNHGNGSVFGVADFNRIESGIVNGSVMLNPSTVTQVLDKNVGREYALICDDDTSNVAYLHLTNSTSSVAVSEGVRLSPGDCYEIGVDNLWVGKVYGIASATTTLTIVEK